MPGLLGIQPSIPSRRDDREVAANSPPAAQPPRRSGGRVEHPWENDSGEYQLVGNLGSGAYGTVYAATHKATGLPVAIKKIMVSIGEEGVPQSVVREVGALRQVGDHVNIARLVEVRHGLINDCELYIHLIFERCDWDLYAFLLNIPRALPEIQIRHFARQILTGLDYLHSKNVVHRDLKPQNILVNLNGAVKLTDFGLARAFSGSAFTPVVVTLWYRSPELILQCDYNTAVDVWSAACILAEMYLGTALFPGQTEREQLMKIFE